MSLSNLESVYKALETEIKTKERELGHLHDSIAGAQLNLSQLEAQTKLHLKNSDELYFNIKEKNNELANIQIKIEKKLKEAELDIRNKYKEINEDSKALSKREASINSRDKKLEMAELAFKLAKETLERKISEHRESESSFIARQKNYVSQAQDIETELGRLQKEISDKTKTLGQIHAETKNSHVELRKAKDDMDSLIAEANIISLNEQKKIKQSNIQELEEIRKQRILIDKESKDISIMKGILNKEVDIKEMEKNVSLREELNKEVKAASQSILKSIDVREASVSSKEKDIDRRQNKIHAELKVSEEMLDKAKKERESAQKEREAVIELNKENREAIKELKKMEKVNKENAILLKEIAKEQFKLEHLRKDIAKRESDLSKRELQLLSK